jgi:hypothetical protein
VSYYFPKGVGEYHFGVRSLSFLSCDLSSFHSALTVFSNFFLLLLSLRPLHHLLSLLLLRRCRSDPPSCTARTSLFSSLQERHPMKPHRLTLTNHLVLGYGLHKKMDIYEPRSATKEELEAFHDEDYVDFLARCVLFLPDASCPSYERWAFEGSASKCRDQIALGIGF